jgi:2,3-bisphosphoglycerate-dependent phosphoglycerate mutase
MDDHQSFSYQQMPTLILIRHGQSQWNLENRFTGDSDIELTTAGELEAKNAGMLLKAFLIDIAFTSVLKRAIHTLNIVMAEIGRTFPIVKSPALNERNYGQLQGLNKAETIKKYGDEKVLLWRRSFSTRPPGGESLQDTVDRVVPYYKENIETRLTEGQSVLIVAHGNSLRALMMHLENLSEAEIESVEIATGVPRVYEFSSDMKIVKPGYYITKLEQSSN